MLIFYYGLPFLGTLAISDSLATFLVLCLVDFLILKAIWDANSHTPNREYWYWWIELELKIWLNEYIAEWRQWLTNLSSLKKIYFVLAGIVSFIFIYSLCFLFPIFIRTINNPKTEFSDIALAVFAILSGLGAVFAFYTSIVRTETAEQGLITDRINKAVEGLGKSYDNSEPVIEVRLGALYALERIAQDSLRDHVQIMEMLCAYVRYNSRWKDRAVDASSLREDIQTALTIIGRRERWAEGKKHIKKERRQGYRIDLRYCDLYGAQLSFTNLRNARFDGSTLNSADISHANITDASFNNTELAYTKFHRAVTKLICTHEGDFSKCVGLVQEQIEDMYCGIRVNIPSHLKRSHAWPTKELNDNELETDYLNWTFDRFGMDMLLNNF